MVMSNITLKGMEADLPILGSTQRFIYGNADPDIKFQIYSLFDPIFIKDSVISIESRNIDLSGFRWKHTTKTTDMNGFGSFAFQSFTVDGAGTDVITYDGLRLDLLTNTYCSGTSIGRRESAVVYWNNNSTNTPINVANTFTKALGATTLNTDSISALMTDNNRLSYNNPSAPTSTFSVKASVSFQFAAAGTPLLSISLYKNGITQLLPIASVTAIAAANVYTLSVETLTTLISNDYIELWVSSSITNATGITIKNGSISFNAA